MAAERNGNRLAVLERRLCDAADQLWANSPLRASEYSTPFLRLILLRSADSAFTKSEVDFKSKTTRRRTTGETDYHAHSLVCIPDEASFSRLVQVSIYAGGGGATPVEKKSELIAMLRKAIAEPSQMRRGLPALHDMYGTVQGTTYGAQPIGK